MNIEKRITRFGPTRGFVLLLSCGLLFWGLFVLNPWVSTFAANEFYGTLASIAREEVWGAAFVASGFVMLWGTIKRKVEIISYGAMLGFLLWAFLSTAYALSDPTITPIVTNGILAVIHGWAWLAVKLAPATITNLHIWTDEEVDALLDLVQIRINKEADKFPEI